MFLSPHFSPIYLPTPTSLSFINYLFLAICFFDNNKKSSNSILPTLPLYFLTFNFIYFIFSFFSFNLFFFFLLASSILEYKKIYYSICLLNNILYYIHASYPLFLILTLMTYIIPILLLNF